MPDAHLKPLNLLALPLMDDLFLSMQVRNLHLVDAHLRDLETDFLRHWNADENDSMPLPYSMLVAALSQMWVFSAYEVLRTWREWGRLLESHAAILASPDKTDGQKEEARAKIRRRIAPQSPSIFEFTVEKAEQDAAFVAEVSAALKVVEPTFEIIDVVRIPLAKHEIAKGRSLRDVAPGYTRFDRTCGSAYWTIERADHSRFIATRHDLAWLVGVGPDTESNEQREEQGPDDQREP